MAIPGFQDLMLPLLKLIGDGKEHTSRNVIENLAGDFKLTEEEKRVLLSSGKQPVFDNRVGWARTYMKKAGLIESPQRGVFKISQEGIGILKTNPTEINIKFLGQFPKFIEFHKAQKKGLEASRITSTSREASLDKTPEETLEFAYEEINRDLAQDILDHLKKCQPAFFERIVVELLVKMGYGGSFSDAGKAIGKSGDEGIDGIIKEDKLGLDVVYVQAKRWEGSVGRPEIHKFAGALHGQQARKGIFITTSDFSKDARDFVKNIELRIVLINGEDLAQLMIDYDIGVSKTKAFELKRLDSDYFEEE